MRTGASDDARSRDFAAEDAAAPRKLTVATALELPVLQRGVPEVVAGSGQLSRPVRWVHIAESPDVPSVLRGGELLLTEGMMFTGPGSDRSGYVAKLAERGVAGVVFELSKRLPKVPADLHEAFSRHDVPLIVLHVPVPFIEVTEALHTLIVNGQYVALQEADDVQQQLNEVALSGASTSDLLDALAEAVTNPIVFERDNGGIAYLALAGASERDALAAWQLVARGLPGAPSSTRQPLPAVAGEELGSLTMLGWSGPITHAHAVALQRAAVLISLTLSHSRDGDALAAWAGRGLLSALLAGEVAPMTAADRAASAGFSAPALLPVAVSRSRHTARRLVSVENRMWRRLWDEVAQELRGRRMPAIMDVQSTNTPALVVIGLKDVNRRSAAADGLASCIASLAARHFGDRHAAVVSVGPAVHTWPSVVDGLAVAVDAVPGALFARPRDWHDALDVDLDRLLWSLRENQDLARFTALHLNRLVEYDRRRKAHLVATLDAFLENNGHKADAARALHLERQSLYNRLERIEKLLGVDLSDSEVRLSLHLSLRAMHALRGSSGRPVGDPQLSLVTPDDDLSVGDG